MKLKIFILSFLSLGILFANAQAPMHPYSIKNLPKKGPGDNTALQVGAINTTSNKAYKVTVADLWPYGMYTSLISQSSTAAPTATVLQKTIPGTATWARTAAGTYTLKIIPAAFLSTKTIVFTMPTSTAATSDTIPRISYRRLNDSMLQFKCTIPSVAHGLSDSLVDGRLSGAPLEVRAYH